MDSIQLKHLGNLLLEHHLGRMVVCTTDGMQEIVSMKLNVGPPTIHEWTDIVYGIYVNEKISIFLRVGKRKLLHLDQMH